MYRDKKISVKTYCDVLKTLILLILDILSFHSHISKWGYDVSAWGSPQKSAHRHQNVGDVSIFNCNKLNFMAR